MMRSQDTLVSHLQYWKLASFRYFGLVFFWVFVLSNFLGDEKSFAQTARDRQTVTAPTGFEKENFELVVQATEHELLYMAWHGSRMIFGRFFDMEIEKVEELGKVVNSKYSALERKFEQLLDQRDSFDFDSLPEKERMKRMLALERITYLQGVRLWDKHSLQVKRAFEKNTRPIQRKQLRQYAIYQATLRGLLYNNLFSRKYQEGEDYYLEWPELLAEFFEFPESDVLRLRKNRESIESRQSKEEQPKKRPTIKGLLSVRPKESANALEKTALRNLVKFVKYQKNHQRRWILRWLKEDRRFREQLEFSEKQTSAIEGLELSPVRCFLNEKRDRWLYFGTSQQLEEMESILNKAQMRKLRSLIDRNTLAETGLDRGSEYQLLVEACIQEYSFKQLCRIYMNLESLIEKRYEEQDTRIERQLKEILSVVGAKKRRTLKKYLGKRSSKFIDVISFKPFLVSTYKVSRYPTPKGEMKITERVVKRKPKSN